MRTRRRAQIALTSVPPAQFARTLAACLFVLIPTAVLAVCVSAAQIEACFSPPLPDGCDPSRAIEGAIGAARASILVQAYEITPGPLVRALIEAHRRGVAVRAIVDYKQLTDRRYNQDAIAVGQLAASGIPVMVDHPSGLMHDKLMIIDGQTVLTGSFNYTYSAEHRNVENLLVIHDPALAAQYEAHWQSRANASRPLRTTGAWMGSGLRTDHAVSQPLAAAGPIIGNRRTRIYQWPGCPYYNRISFRDRVEFATANQAQQSGYRPARNCR
jgi:phosphatidylserine/phosphatidylglycerophosphate/cardiolipin synthase-like enzyme